MTLTGETYGAITAIATAGNSRFHQTRRSLASCGAARVSRTIPIPAASIALDYTNAAIDVMVNGVPKQATVVDPTGAAVTTHDRHRELRSEQSTDRSRPPSSTTQCAAPGHQFRSCGIEHGEPGHQSADRDGQPFVTVSTARADSKPIRVRGPLDQFEPRHRHLHRVVRPFYDEIDSFGHTHAYSTMRIPLYRSTASPMSAPPGHLPCRSSPPASTMIAAYTTFQPTRNLARRR